MIMSVKEFKTFVETDMAEPLIEAKLQSLELLIRKYTNNNFQNRLYRRTADIIGGSFYVTAVPFKTGDTIQVSTTQLSNGLKVPCLNEGLFTIDKVDNNSFSVKEDVMDESNVLCTKIVYPMDVKMGVVNLMKWDMSNRDKVGIMVLFFRTSHHYLKQFRPIKHLQNSMQRSSRRLVKIILEH